MFRKTVVSVMSLNKLLYIKEINSLSVMSHKNVFPVR